MRKLTLIFTFLLAALGAHAYQSGQFSLGLGAVYSPLALGTDFGEMNVDDTQATISHDAKLGKPGLGAELQALYFISPRVGVGLSFADQYFSSDLSSGWGLNTHTRMRNYMAVGHVFLTPQHAYKLYIPLGLGLAQTDFAMDFRPKGSSKEHFCYNGFAYYVGLGVEKEIAPRWSVGLEARYNGNKFHASTTRLGGNHVTVYPRANFLSLILRAVYTL